jgi:hypothetical protein
MYILFKDNIAHRSCLFRTEEIPKFFIETHVVCWEYITFYNLHFTPLHRGTTDTVSKSKTSLPVYTLALFGFAERYRNRIVICFRKSRTMALGSTQPLREMITRNISWGVKAAGV